MKILFAGDFSVQDRAIKLFEDRSKAAHAFNGVEEVCIQHDLSIVNFESPVTKCKTGILKDGPCIRNPKSSIEILQKIGFGLFTLANNHLKDYGEQGVIDTFNALKEQQMAFVGAGRNIDEARCPFIFECNEEKIAIINVCENESSIATDFQAGACPISEINLYYDITTLRSKVDYIAVIIHGGREHFRLPTPRMKKLYHYIIDLGADFIVNHHQHCYSGFEEYNGKYIFYGLGNFYFDNPKKRNNEWNKGFLLSVNFDKKISFEIIPYTQCDDKPEIQIEPYDSVAHELEKINEIIVDDAKLAQAYKNMVMKEHVLSPMQPYTLHYVRALYHRGILPDLISKKKKVAILNSIRCETHRELLIAYLEKILLENE
jgi:hypothetical protein